MARIWLANAGFQYAVDPRTALLGQTELVGRSRGPACLHDCEPPDVSSADFTVAYVKVIGKYPEMVAKAVA